MAFQETDLEREKRLEKKRKQSAEYYQRNKASIKQKHKDWLQRNLSAHAARVQRWRKANPEKAKIINQRNHSTNKVKRNLKTKEWRGANPDRVKKWYLDARDTPEYKQSRSAYITANKDKISERSMKWAKANPERFREIAAEYRKNNAGEADRLRRARKQKVEHADCSWKIRLLHKMPLCQYCFQLIDGKPTIEHVVPIARGGGHVPSNLVAACPACNYSKRDKLLCEWRGRREA